LAAYISDRRHLAPVFAFPPSYPAGAATPRRWSGLARAAVTGLAGGLLACAGCLVDVERGEVRRDQVALVRGDRITAIQPATTKSRPARG
jgi:hypothetical protein